MKIIHIADTHLGATPHLDSMWQIDRGKELWSALERVVHIAEEEKVDLLLIAGDMFHRQPLLRELKELNYIFSYLTHTKVVFIAGNHDYMKHNSYYQTFEWGKNVYCLKDKECKSIYFQELNVEIYGLSYDYYEIKEDRYALVTVRDKSRINILLGHGGDGKHIPFSKNDLASKGFDYIALGHIHTPGVLVSNLMAYAGALEPIDAGDEGPHGFMRVEISKKETKLAFIKSAKREYKTVNVISDATFTNRKLQDVIAQELGKMKRPYDFFKIVISGVRDEDIVYDTQAIYQMGMIVSVLDLTQPDYDFEKIEREYSHTIIGTYIRNMKTEPMTQTKKKALYFGVKAMLDEMR